MQKNRKIRKIRPNILWHLQKYRNIRKIRPNIYRNRKIRPNMWEKMRIPLQDVINWGN